MALLYIPTLALLDYYRPIDVDLFKTMHAILGVFLICMWKKFMFSLSVSFQDYIYDPHATQKANVGMYSGISYPYKSSCLYTFWHCHPYFILILVSALFLLQLQ